MSEPSPNTTVVHISPLDLTSLIRSTIATAMANQPVNIDLAGLIKAAVAAETGRLQTEMDMLRAELRKVNAELAKLQRLQRRKGAARG